MNNTKVMKLFKEIFQERTDYKKKLISWQNKGKKEILLDIVTACGVVPMNQHTWNYLQSFLSFDSFLERKTKPPYKNVINATSSYSTDYLKKIMDIVGEVSEDVKVSVGKDCPMTIECKGEDTELHFQLILAPREEDE